MNSFILWLWQHWFLIGLSTAWVLIAIVTLKDDGDRHDTKSILWLLTLAFFGPAFTFLIIFLFFYQLVDHLRDM